MKALSRVTKETQSMVAMKALSGLDNENALSGSPFNCSERNET